MNSLNIGAWGDALRKRHLPIVPLITLALSLTLCGCSALFRDATPPTPESEETETDRESDSTDESQRETEAETVNTPETIVNFENIPSAEAAAWIERYREGHDPDALILDRDGITLLNRQILESCPTMYDMSAIPASIPGETVFAWVRAAAFPLWQVDGYGNAVTAEAIAEIEVNCAVERIPTTVIPQTAVVTERVNLRLFPTSLRCYGSGDVERYFDRLQETEVILGSPVLILHESADGAYYYIQCANYRGWATKASIALATEADYRRFLPDGEDMVCIIADAVRPSTDILLDMGAAFPYVAQSETHFTVEIPRRDENGRLTAASIDIPKTDAHYGRLPYTAAAFYTQAFKYLGTAYSWGGYNEGVDCSGFVGAVFRSFGILLPRNTGEQSLHGGALTPLTGLSGAEVIDALAPLTAPTALHRPGHVMLLLGTDGDGVYVIHAPTGGQRVRVDRLTVLDKLTAAVTVSIEKSE